jgi:hypothetical protein
VRALSQGRGQRNDPGRIRHPDTWPDPETRAVMLEIAHRYFKLAKLAARNEQDPARQPSDPKKFPRTVNYPWARLAQ